MRIGISAEIYYDAPVKSGNLIARLAASLLVALAARAASGLSGEPAAAPERSFRIHVLRCQWPRDVHGYTTRELRPQLGKCPLEGATFVVETADVDSYCWDRHTIELTREGTDRLVAALGENWVRYHGRNQAFVATLGEKRLYAGVFYLEYAAAAISFPIIHVERRDDRLSFRVRDGVAYRGDGTRRIGMRAVRDFFRSVGKLRCG
ncbi:MAG TPA: hypothetical protein VGG06_07160 [Thermoanaerobaculia bacterium]